METVREISIEAQADILVDSLTVRIASVPPDLALHYSLDGSEPTLESPVYVEALNLTSGTLVRARGFAGSESVTAIVEREFRKVTPRPALSFFREPDAGLQASVHLGKWVSSDQLGESEADLTEIVNHPEVPAQARLEKCTLVLEGFLRCEEAGVQRFRISAAGNLRVLIGDDLIIDGATSTPGGSQTGCVALAVGWHPLRLEWFKPEGEAALLLEHATLDGQLVAPGDVLWAH